MPNQVFISYSHADADRAWIRRFAESLKRHNTNVWLDESEIQVGESLSKAMEKGLRGSDLFVSFVTPESIKRPNLFFEIGAAISMDKPVVALVNKDVKASSLPQPLRNRRFLIQNSPEETAEKLATIWGDLPERSKGKKSKSRRGR